MLMDKSLIANYQKIPVAKLTKLYYAHFTFKVVGSEPVQPQFNSLRDVEKGKPSFGRHIVYAVQERQTSKSLMFI